MPAQRQVVRQSTSRTGRGYPGRIRSLLPAALCLLVFSSIVLLSTSPPLDDPSGKGDLPPAGVRQSCLDYSNTTNFSGCHDVMASLNYSCQCHGQVEGNGTIVHLQNGTHLPGNSSLALGLESGEPLPAGARWGAAVFSSNFSVGQAFWDNPFGGNFTVAIAIPPVDRPTNLTFFVNVVRADGNGNCTNDSWQSFTLDITVKPLQLELAILNVSADASGRPQVTLPPDGEVNLTAVLSANGTRPFGNCTVLFLLDSVPVGTIVVPGDDAGWLMTGALRTIRLNITALPGTGKHTVAAWADPQGAIWQEYRQDDTLSRTFDFEFPAAGSKGFLGRNWPWLVGGCIVVLGTLAITAFERNRKNREQGR